MIGLSAARLSRHSVSTGSSSRAMNGRGVIDFARCASSTCSVAAHCTSRIAAHCTRRMTHHTTRSMRAHCRAAVRAHCPAAHCTAGAVTAHHSAGTAAHAAAAHSCIASRGLISLHALQIQIVAHSTGSILKTTTSCLTSGTH